MSERYRLWLAVMWVLLPPAGLIVALDLDPDSEAALTLGWWVSCLFLYYCLGWMTVFPVKRWHGMRQRWHRGTSGRRSFHARLSRFLNSNEPKLAFWRMVTACLVALALWRFVEWLWDTFGVMSVLVVGGIAWGVRVVLVAVRVVKRWLDGRRGLGQWPNPYGRYYDAWLKLNFRHRGDGTDHTDNYYVWLAHKMGNRSP